MTIEYAMYRGDEFIDIGTIDELADKYYKKRELLAYLSKESTHEKMKNDDTQLLLYKIGNKDGEQNMKTIEIPIGTRGSRQEFEFTYNKIFLEFCGLINTNSNISARISKTKEKQRFHGWLYLVNTKNGLVCSFNEEDILTYLGHGIWDLKPYKAAKSEDDDNPW